MDQLGAVNIVLRKLGEIPVTSVDEQYPTLAIVLPALDEAQRMILAEGYWFNTFYEYTLAPDTDGRVMTPDSTLKFFPKDGQYAFIGDRITRASDGEDVLNIPIKGKLVLNMAFDTLPEVAQYAIAYWAAYDTYMSDIGDDTTAQELLQRRDGFLGELSGDHTQSRQLNARTKKQVMRWRSRLRT